MNRSIPLALVAGALLVCAGAGNSQAAALSGIGNGASQSHAIATHVGWRHRHCWWRRHRRHCRYWH